MNRTKLMPILLLLLVILGAGYWWGVKRQAPSSSSYLEVLVSHPGLKSEEWKDRYVLVHFWAKWCEPCQDEIPKLVQFSEQIAKNPVLKDRIRVLAISLDPTLEESKSILPQAGENLPFTFLLVLDQNERLARAFGSFQYPESYLLNPSAEVIEKWVGPQKWMDPQVLNYFTARTR